VLDLRWDTALRDLQIQLEPHLNKNKKMKSKKLTTPSIRTSTSRPFLRRGSLPSALVLAVVLFALSSTVRAVTPAPDGGYPGNNTAEGDNALFSLTGGTDNTAVGFNALYNNTGYFNTANGSQALLTNTTGQANTANGFDALFLNTTGDYNTANGVSALFSNTTGSSNTASGASALDSNTTGSNNTANGLGALFSNTTGNNNAANGYEALLSNTTGSSNTANGYEALFSNTTGFYNTANGFDALFSNTTGGNNTATGVGALYSNTTGRFNTADGLDALFSNTTGRQNTANGFTALFSNTTGNSNTAIGQDALGNNTTGGSNIALGASAGSNLTTGDSNIDIGNDGVAAEAKTIRIGEQRTQTATFIAGISGATASGGAPVYVNTSGQLGTLTSSERFKDNIKPMGTASEAILALRPVMFRYKHELDPEGIPQFGLVAEQVAEVNPDLVARDDRGKPYTVRYEAVNAMLLNEFLKEHRQVQHLKSAAATQEATIAQLKKGMEVLTARLKEQASQIQKVSDKVEISKPGPRTVANNQ
jgi:hypothetical protein